MSYKVHVEPSGHEFEAEGEESVLDAALRHGYAFPYGCRNGVCGSCKGRLLSGNVHYAEDMLPGLEGEPAGSDAALFCQALPRSDLRIQVHEVESVAEIAVRTLPCRVVRIDHLADDVIRLFLKLPEGQRMQFLAGQYIDFLLGDGRRRAFSIANAPHDDQFIELHIRHVDGGAFTAYVFEQMKEKTILRFEGPLGTFFLREDSDRPIIFMGGGTGFAPLKGMIEHAFQIGVERPMHLYWGVRAKPDLYLPELPGRWVREHANFRFTPVLSEPRPEDNWTGRTGFVHQAVLQDYPDLSDFEAYISGPPVMVEAGRREFLAHGMAEDAMYSDAFEFAADSRGKGQAG